MREHPTPNRHTDAGDVHLLGGAQRLAADEAVQADRARARGVLLHLRRRGEVLDAVLAGRILSGKRGCLAIWAVSDRSSQSRPKYFPIPKTKQQTISQNKNFPKQKKPAHVGRHQKKCRKFDVGNVHIPAGGDLEQIHPLNYYYLLSFCNIGGCVEPHLLLKKNQKT